MSGPSIFFEDVNERQGGFLRRTFLLGGFAGIGLTALTARLAYLQTLQTSRYRSMSAENQFNLRLIPPPRGLIKDRNGVVLAGNRPSFRLLVIRDETKDLDTTLDEVAQLLPATAARRRTLLREINQSPRFVPVAVATDLTWEEFARVNLHAPQLPGVMADVNEARFYPFGGAFAHVVGYVGKVTDRDVEKVKKSGKDVDPILMHPGFRIGKQGVESALDEELRGTPGVQRVEVDATGRQVGEDRDNGEPPQPGAEVVLTLDADIQMRALEVFGEESGAAVVMDIHNGDLLCLASSPSFDPNAFVGGIGSKLYRAYSEYDHKPLLDKALTGTYPAGSTFKTMVALAALESGISPHKTRSCGGAWRFGNHVFHCDKASGHGTVDMHKAIVTSCDVYFYQTALEMGPDIIAATARKFGINQIFDIGIGNQKKGVLPDRAWKKRAFRRPEDQIWYPGETPSFGIGQGALAVNPLQLCVMTARLANGRKALNPRLIKSIGGKERPAGSAVPDLPISADHIDIIRSAMADVANDVSGTAYRAAQLGLGPIKMAGKTGTAQAHSITSGASRATLHLEWERRDHAWFIAFAPYDAPRYAITVLVEHGGWGAGAAAPRAREIMRTTLLKDPAIIRRIQATGATVEAPPPIDDSEGSGLPEAPTLVGAQGRTAAE
ncbi:MAG: penicillin-binding protein 2 [Caulobacteraceae bacterium]|nr:penicillin-binding protein 2 [Caulobacteraceae bacterium]